MCLEISISIWPSRCDIPLHRAKYIGGLISIHWRRTGVVPAISIYVCPPMPANTPSPPLTSKVIGVAPRRIVVPGVAPSVVIAGVGPSIVIAGVAPSKRIIEDGRRIVMVKKVIIQEPRCVTDCGRRGIARRIPIPKNPKEPFFRRRYRKTTCEHI